MFVTGIPNPPHHLSGLLPLTMHEYCLAPSPRLIGLMTGITDDGAELVVNGEIAETDRLLRPSHAIFESEVAASNRAENADFKEANCF